MQLTINQAERTDLSAILQLQKTCYLSEARIYKNYNIPPLQQELPALEKEFAKSLFLKAVVSSEIVGSVRAFSNGKTCFVGKLIVKESFQNRGIGKLLLAAIETNFPTCSRFELFTGHKSEKNLHLYQKLGYKIFKEGNLSDSLKMIYLEKLT